MWFSGTLLCFLDHTHSKKRPQPSANLSHYRRWVFCLCRQFLFFITDFSGIHSCSRTQGSTYSRPFYLQWFLLLWVKNRCTLITIKLQRLPLHPSTLKKNVFKTLMLSLSYSSGSLLKQLSCTSVFLLDIKFSFTRRQRPRPWKIFGLLNEARGMLSVFQADIMYF